MLATTLGPFLLTKTCCAISWRPRRVITVARPLRHTWIWRRLDEKERFSPMHVFGATKAANLLSLSSFAARQALEFAPTPVTRGIVVPKLMARGLGADQGCHSHAVEAACPGRRRLAELAISRPRGHDRMDVSKARRGWSRRKRHLDARGAATYGSALLRWSSWITPL